MTILTGRGGGGRGRGRGRGQLSAEASPDAEAHEDTEGAVADVPEVELKAAGLPAGRCGRGGRGSRPAGRLDAVDRNGTVIPVEHRMRFRPNGCAKCRKTPACAPSCWLFTVYRDA